jgi:hypothetical protein
MSQILLFVEEEITMTPSAERPTDFVVCFALVGAVMRVAAIGYGNASQNIGTKEQVLRRKKNAAAAAHATTKCRSG